MEDGVQQFLDGPANKQPLGTLKSLQTVSGGREPVSELL
jgi:hypothetical protein